MSDRISSHTVGYKLHGFVFKKITPLPQVRSVALELEHEKTGARILHLHNDDTENLFSINFPTPPADDTGVPHILEHAVLSGSRKYPVRDPFFEMVKMSMATFINAMTGWDATYYPVTSNVKKDLFNLAEVYFDAVFNPLLTEETFQREGHHLAPVDKQKPDGDLKITGIVYNEMKGAFSSPEAVLYRQALRNLLPETFYKFESGGDPESIPNLTWEGLRNFHSTYYHPSNAMFVLYGDITTSDFLAFLNARLSDFERQEIPVKFTQQPRWHEPRRFTQEYPIAADETLAEKTFLAVSWLVGRGDDLASVALWQVISELLAGNEGSPLKMALIDSHLGDDLCWAGFMGIGYETAFSVALKGSEEDRAEKLEKLLEETLSELASKPIAEELIDAAFHQVSYRYLEIKSQYPLHMLDGVLSGWVYGTAPEEFLKMGAYIEECQRQVTADPMLIPNLLRKMIVENPHRLTLTLRPSREVQARKDAELEQKMKALRASLTDEQTLAIAARAAEIEGKAGDPNPPEAVALLPQLRVGDLPRCPRPLPTTVSEVEGVTLLRNDVFSNGVNYVYLDFDLEGLPAELWPYLPHYTESVEKCGAAGFDYEEIAQRLSASTGSLSCWTSFSGHASQAGKSVLRLRANMKALDSKIAPAMDIYGKVLFGTDPGADRERLLDVVTQLRSHCRTEFVENGLGTAQLHALRGMGIFGALDEMVHGLPQLALVEELTAKFDAQFAPLTEKIAAIRDFIAQKGRLRVSFTGSDAAFETVRSSVAGWARNAAAPQNEVFLPSVGGPRTREGLAAPVQVAHCAQAMPAPHHSHPDKMLISLGMHLLRFDYFLSEIRFKGNAYGAYGTYNGLGGSFMFSSYRDPHIVRTLEVFAKVGDFVSQVGWGQADVDRAIIALAKNTEPPMRPASVTDQVLTMDRCGITQEMREENYARMLRADPREVKRALEEHLLPALAEASICVVSSREKLEEANARLGAGPLAIENILKG